MKKRVIVGSKFPRTQNFWGQKNTIDESEIGMHLDRQTIKQTNKHKDMQADKKYTCRHTDRETHRLIYRQTKINTYIHSYIQTDRQAPSNPYTFTALSYPAVMIKFGLYGQKDAERTELLGAVELST